MSFTPHAADLNMSEQHEGKKSHQGHCEQTSVSRWKDSPDPLPDTDVVMYPGRVDKTATKDRRMGKKNKGINKKTRV